jgi:FAD/FMN-containing dehydrogenase
MSADRSFAAACEAVVGSANVLTAAADMEAYAHDFWRIIQGRPALVVRPADTGQVAAVVRLAAEHGVALVPQSGNTGLVGGNVPDESGTQVVLSLARLDRVRAVDAAGLSMVVEAGCTLAAVQETAAAADRLFPLSLGSEGTCRIAGNLASNAGGINVLRYGMARDLVLGLEVVMADGRVWDGLRTLRKDNTGYDLKQLFLGSEGTLGIITAAALKLYPRPRERVTLFLGVSSPAVALDLLARAQARFGELVSSFELMAAPCVEASVAHVPGLRFPLESRAPWYVLTEVAWSLPDGLEAASDLWLEEVLEADLVLDATRAQSEAQRSMLWRMREGVSEGTTKLGAIARHDISVPVASIPRLIERGEALIAEMPGCRLIPFGHVGDGNLHFNVVLPPDTADLAGTRKRLQGRVFDLVQELGGSISAEHGIGRAKRAELHARKDPLAIELMGRLKATLDPQGILNPGVIV